VTHYVFLNSWVELRTQHWQCASPTTPKLGGYLGALSFPSWSMIIKNSARSSKIHQRFYDNFCVFDDSWCTATVSGVTTTVQWEGLQFYDGKWKAQGRFQRWLGGQTYQLQNKWRTSYYHLLITFGSHLKDGLLDSWIDSYPPRWLPNMDHMDQFLWVVV